MPVTELNHYFVRANDLGETKAFYCDVLGFQVMPRPAFPFPGYWLGVNGKIQVHMGPTAFPTPSSTTSVAEACRHRSRRGVDHIAFVGQRPGGFIRRFKERGPRLPAALAAEFDLYHIFIKDPKPHHRAELLRPQDVTDWGGETTRRCRRQPGCARDVGGFTDVTHEGVCSGREPWPPLARAGRPRPRSRRARWKGPAGRPAPAASSASISQAWGGMELPFVAIFDVPFEIARGCASTAWNLANLGIHHWMLALYDTGQAEVWGPDPTPSSPPASPTRRAAAAAWTALRRQRLLELSSGVDPATGTCCGGHRARRRPRGRSPHVPWCRAASTRSSRLARRRERSTGSKSVRPRTCSFPSTGPSLCTCPAAARSSPAPAPIPTRSIASRCASLGSHCLAAAGVGNAQAAVDLTIEASRSAAPTTRGCACGPSGGAARWPGRGPGRRRPSHHPHRLRGRPSESHRRAGRRRSRRSCGSSAMWWAMEAVRGGGRFAARDGRATASTPLPDPAPLPAISTRSRPTSASAGRAGRAWALVAMGGEFSSPTM